MPLRRARRSWRFLLVPGLVLLLAGGLVACDGSSDSESLPAATEADQPPAVPDEPRASATPVAPAETPRPSRTTPEAPIPELPTEPSEPASPATSASESTAASGEPPTPPAEVSAPEPETSPTAAPTLPEVPLGPFTAIGVAGRRACAWTEAEARVCWGGGKRGQWSGLSSRASATDTPCAVTDGDGSACLLSEAAAEAPPGHYTAISSIGSQGCGLTEVGAVVCWGEFWNGLPDLPPGRYTAISVGAAGDTIGSVYENTCAVADAGEIICWKDGYGAADRGLFRYPGDYVAVQAYGSGFCALTAGGELINHWGEDCFTTSVESTRYTAVSLGRNHDCALTAAGAAVCQRGLFGFLFAGAVTVMHPPDPAPGRYTAISVGDGYACALTAAGEAVCWGEEENKVTRPDLAPGRYVGVSVGGGHTCALTEDGEAVCWGWNNFGQAAPPPGRYTAISAGYAGTCALTEDGKAVCWGWNNWGQVKLPPSRYTAISVGFVRGCALTDVGGAVCTGYGSEDSLVETPSGSFITISLGWDGHACALTPAGEAVCWGWDREGQTEVPPGRYTAIRAGAYATWAIRESGEGICWGDADGLSLRGSYVAISAGVKEVCALTAAGEVRCRGHGARYTLPAGHYTAVSLGWFGVCALTTDGAVVCSEGTTDGRPPSFSPNSFPF